ncbi:hypothetical protein Tco_0828797, partial [Tanacetum coccineum]
VSSVAATAPTAIDAGKNKDVLAPSVFADVNLQEVYVPEWSVTKDFELNDGRLCANMIDHFTSPTFFKTVRGMEHEQLFVEFNVSAAHNLSLSSEAKVESMEVARLHTRVSSLEAIKGSLQGEVASAKEHNGLLEQKCGSLKLKVNELETSSTDLRGKLEMYEGSMKQLEEFQDNFMKPLEARLAEIDADFTSIWRHFKVIDLLRLDDAVAEVLGMTNLQPDVGQLMVPVHHKQDKVVIGSQALSVALETCHSRVRKMERNQTEHLPFLKDVFVSIDHPLSAEALTILPETSTEPPVTALITTALSTVVFCPDSDPFLLVEDYENPDLAGAVPEDVILGLKGEGKVGGSTEGDVDVGDLVLSQLENKSRDTALSTMVIRPTPDPFLLVEDYENLDLTGEGDAGDVFSHLENEARDAVL